MAHRIFRWRDAFKIISEMFDIKPEGIAGYLSVDAATVSRLRKGITKNPTAIKPTEMYKSLFSPRKVQDITSIKYSEKELLEILREVIEELGFRWVMEDLWTKSYEIGDYEKFVVSMLMRINKRFPRGVPLTFLEVLKNYSPEAYAQRLRETRNCNLYK